MTEDEQLISDVSLINKENMRTLMAASPEFLEKRNEQNRINFFAYVLRTVFENAQLGNESCQIPCYDEQVQFIPYVISGLIERGMEASHTINVEEFHFGPDDYISIKW